MCQADRLGSRGQNVEASISGSSKHLVKSRTRHAGLKRNLQTPPDTTNADAKEDIRIVACRYDLRCHCNGGRRLPTREGGPPPEQGTAASHSRDSNGAGIASADAKEDTEAIAGPTNTDHGSRVWLLSGYAGPTGKYHEARTDTLTAAKNKRQSAASFEIRLRTRAASQAARNRL